MPLIISDETLAQMNLDEHEARIEIACRLFAADKMSIAQARRLAGLDRIAFEDECKKREIPVYHLDEEYWEGEQRALEAWEKKS